MGRKYNIARFGSVVISLFAVMAILMPEKADTLTKLGAALAGLLAAIGAAIAYEDGKQATARADVEAAAHYANATKGDSVV